MRFHGSATAHLPARLPTCLLAYLPDCLPVSTKRQDGHSSVRRSLAGDDHLVLKTSPWTVAETGTMSLCKRGENGKATARSPAENVGRTCREAVTRRSGQLFQQKIVALLKASQDEAAITTRRLLAEGKQRGVADRLG